MISMISLSAIITILVIVAVLAFLVLIHELGHFLAAKWAGVRVKEFGLGYPPRAMTLFRWDETDFTLNWIPFGGFVQMDGEDVLDPDTYEEETSGEGEPFFERPWWQRLVVILAGATVNFIFGVVAFGIVYSIIGIPQPLAPYIDEVVDGTAAAAAGLPEDVRILALEADQATMLRPTTADEVT